MLYYQAELEAEWQLETKQSALPPIVAIAFTEVQLLQVRKASLCSKRVSNNKLNTEAEKDQNQSLTVTAQCRPAISEIPKPVSKSAILAIIVPASPIVQRIRGTTEYSVLTALALASSSSKPRVNTACSEQ